MYALCPFFPFLHLSPRSVSTLILATRLSCSPNNLSSLYTATGVNHASALIRDTARTCGSVSGRGNLKVAGRSYVSGAVVVCPNFYLLADMSRGAVLTAKDIPRTFITGGSYNQATICRNSQIPSPSLTLSSRRHILLKNGTVAQLSTAIWKPRLIGLGRSIRWGR